MSQPNPDTLRKFSVDKSNDVVEEEEEGEQEREEFGRNLACQIQIDHTGPFEPLVLSEDGEVPTVQVIIYAYMVFGFRVLKF